MSMTVEKLVTEAMDLPPALRAYVAERLIESLDAPETPALSAAWQAELRRRGDEIDQGTVKLIDADQAFAKAHAALK